MSCCWKPVAAKMHVISNSPLPQAEGNGTIPLQAYPDCRQPHAGAHRADTIYIVDWRGQHERIFASNESKQAVIYRNSIDSTLQLAPVSANQICNQAIADLYGD